MQNSTRWEEEDEGSRTAFKNENGKKYLHVWDLDNIEKNSLNKDIASPSTSDGPESTAGGDRPINLISNSDERIIGCSDSDVGLSLTDRFTRMLPWKRILGRQNSSI